MAHDLPDDWTLSSNFDTTELAEDDPFELIPHDPLMVEELSLPAADMLAARLPCLTTATHDDSSVVQSLLPCDVVFGKGNRLSKPGNIKYRAAKQRLVHRFLANPTPTVKKEVAMEIMNFVHSQGGRFLEDGDRQGEWRVAAYASALKKTKQLLTDANKKKNKKLEGGTAKVTGKKTKKPRNSVRTIKTPCSKGDVISTGESTLDACQAKEISADFHQSETVAPLHGVAGAAKMNGRFQSQHYYHQQHHHRHAVNGQPFHNPSNRLATISFAPCFMGSVQVDLSSSRLESASFHLNMALDMMKYQCGEGAQQGRSAVNFPWQYGRNGQRGDDDELAYAKQRDGHHGKANHDIQMSTGSSPPSSGLRVLPLQETNTRQRLSRELEHPR